MKVKILNLLRKTEDYISGEDIAARLSLSRACVWKHVQELRDLGYEVAAVPHLGYKLEKIPDKLYPWEIKDGLKTKFIAKEVFYHEKISSTMDIAQELGKAGCAEGTLVCAEHQSKGRGRLGRNWASPKSKGLYLSLILRPNISLKELPCITLLCAVALAVSIKRKTGLPLSIKWPNDILIDDKKLAGILTELNAEQDRVNFVVVGMGINVNTDIKDLPGVSTSLYVEFGKKLNRLELLKDILEEFEKTYLDFKAQGFSPVINKWRKLSYIWGHRVKIALANKVIEGEALDLDEDGSLLLRTPAGTIEKVSSGQVIECKP